MQTVFMSMPSCFNRKSQSGFSILESIIALAIIAIVIFATYSSYYKLETSSKRLARNNICELHNKKIFSIISSQKLDPNVSNDFLQPVFSTIYSESGSGLGRPVFTMPVSLKSRFEDVLPVGDTNLYIKRGPAIIDPQLTIKNNGTESRMPLLANSYMGYLADLYNNDYKQSGGLKNLPPELIPPFEDLANSTSVGSANQRYKTETKLHLSLYRIADKNLVADLTPFFPMPASQYPEKDVVTGTAVTKYFPYSYNKVIMAQFPSWMREDLGIKVTLQSRVIDANTNVLIQTCENYADYEYANKLQNVIDFADFDAAIYAVNGIPTFNSSQLREVTVNMSSKHSLGMRDTHPLAPIFTNYNAATPNLGRDRNLCSQNNQQITNFFVKFRVKNLDKEPGAVPVCIDTSTQWLAAEVAGGGWCPKGSYNYSDGSHVKINYDWRPGDLGWVPCESLKFCGQQPDRVEVKKDLFTNSVEYQYHYTVGVNDNSILNRLWGCELKYMAATVDVAGNLSYLPGKKPDLGSNPAVWATFISPLNPEAIREIKPKVYFKPPPCYLCSCKACKSGKGGFFGSLFSIFVFFVLIIATGGTAAYALSGYLTTSLGVLAAMCGAGNLGCETSSSGGQALSSPVGNQFTSCTDSNITHCNCGSTCSKKSVPGPRWIDSLDGEDPTAIANSLPKSCPIGNIRRTLGPQWTTVDMRLSYKVQARSAAEVLMLTEDYLTYSPVLNSTNSFYVLRSLNAAEQWQSGVVQHKDEVIWQEFNRSTGIYCLSRNICNNGQWAVSKLSYPPSPQEGCFKVKTAHSIDWAPNTAVYETQDKPATKAPVCLEVDFTPGTFNETGETLKGYADLTHECAAVKPENNMSPYPYPKPDFTDPRRRVVGTIQTNVCAAPGQYENSAGTLITITPAAAVGIGDGTDSCGGGSTSGKFQFKQNPQLQKFGYIFNLLVNQCYALPANFNGGCEGFRCWTMCLPPVRLPTGPMNNLEQMYYETYTQADRELKFCNDMDRTQFDIIR